MKGSGVRKVKWVLITTVGFLICFAVYLFVAPRDRMFRGKPESQWIAELKYSEDQRAKQWKAFGPEGVDVLVRALETANAEANRSKFYNRCAGILSRIRPLQRLLPFTDRQAIRIRRMCLLSLLSRLGNDAMPAAVSVMIQTARDADWSISMMAISFFTDGEDDKAPLTRIDRGTKRELLDVLIAAMQHSDWGMRNNAAIALGYYADEKEKVAPVLVKALADNKAEVQLLAAKSLLQVAPDELLPNGAIPMVIAIAKSSDEQIAYRAVELLGDMKKEPVKVLPVLCEAALRTNILLSDTAIHALTQFPEQSAITLPVLEKVAEQNSQTSRHAKDAVKKIKAIASAKNN